MKKVGIITFYLNHNYGTTLQCYALKKTIEAMGDYEVIIIPYSFVNRIENGFGGGELSRKYDCRINAFSHFLREIIGCKLPNISVLNNESVPACDYYVIGSDTVWNTVQTNNDEAFFGSFADENTKLIAYAPSLGVNDPEKTLNKSIFDKYIDKFYALSVREKSDINFLRQFTDKEIYSVIDPTLLADKECYESIAENGPHEKYILVYLIYDTTEYIEYIMNLANRIARKKKMKVYHFIYNIPDYVLGDIGESFSFASPEQFLGLVKNSELVFTNSYHGTIFSIIYQKKFYSVCRKDSSKKVRELLEMLGLKDRILKPGLDINDFETDINYEKVEDCIAIERQKSMEYLMQSLI